MPIVGVDGAQLHYETRGGGPSLLLIAGGGLDGGTFEPFARVLARDFTLVTVAKRIADAG